MTDQSSAKQIHASVLTINGGSSSIKFALFEARDSLLRILGGGIERIGMSETTLRVKGLNESDNFSRSVTAADHKAAVNISWNRTRRNAKYGKRGGDFRGHQSGRRARHSYG